MKQLTYRQARFLVYQRSRFAQGYGIWGPFSRLARFLTIVSPGHHSFRRLAPHRSDWVRLLLPQRKRRLFAEARGLSLGQRPSLFGLPSGDGSRGAHRDSGTSFVHGPDRTRWWNPWQRPIRRSLTGEAGGLPSFHRSRLWRPGDHSESVALADPLPRGDCIV